MFETKNTTLTLIKPHVGISTVHARTPRRFNHLHICQDNIGLSRSAMFFNVGVVHLERFELGSRTCSDRKFQRRTF